MITEGSWDMLSNLVDKIGVFGIWYENSFELLMLVLGFAALCILAVIGFFAILAIIFKKKKKY